MCFLRRGVVSTSPNPQAGGPPLVSCPRLLIQFIHSYPPYRRPFLHPQPEDAPCRRDRDPHSWGQQILQKYKVVSDEFDTFIFEINLIHLFSKSIWYIYFRNQFDTFIFEINLIHLFSKSIWYIYFRNQFDTFVFEINLIHLFSKSIWNTYFRNQFDTLIFEINLTHLFSKSIWYIYIRNQFDTFIFETNPVQTFCTCRAKEFQVLKQNCAEFIQETSNMKSTIWKSVFGKCNCESQPV